ncbi:MAG TPA: ABC transporter permease [Terriglobales bacterium]|nr:ABC transporter permease [Terriglobales bacterium]
MSKLLIIAKREYVQRVKSKGFVIFTILLPALMAGYILFIVAISRASQNQPSHLAVIDLSGEILPVLRQELTDKLSNGKPKFTIEAVTATPATLPQAERRLEQAVLAGRYTGFLVLPADILTSHTAQYHAKNVILDGQTIQNRLRDAVTRVRLRQAGIAADQVPQYFAAFDLQGLRITPEGERQDQGQTLALAYILGGLLYFVLIFYGMNFMSSVVEEKTSRVAEVVLSSVSAFGLLMGKILGVAGAALTQACIWGACLALVGAYSAVVASAAGGGWLRHIPPIGPMIYISFIIFFVLGFLLYSSLYAAVGATVSSEQEMRQSAMPITLLIVAAFFISFTPMMQVGTSLTAVILSEIPFFAPILMMVRIPIANPPFWQIALSWALCAATLVIIIQFTAKIYRVGILMTGKRPNLPELLRWLKYS